ALRMYAAGHAEDPGDELLRSIRDLAKTGDSTRLADYLRSAPAAGPVERELVAMALGTPRPRPKPSGRPPEATEKLVAHCALGFYGAWRILSTLRGDRSRGHQGEMRDLAACHVIEIWLRHLPIANDEELYTFWEKVRSLMDRSRERRKLPDGLRGELDRFMRIFSQNPWE